MSHVSVVCCQVRGLCVGLITCLEKCGVYERDREGPVAPWPGGQIFFPSFCMATKLDLAHQGKNKGSGCSRMGCRGRYLVLGWGE